jgi:DNA-binding transcriptional MerR regulator
MLNGELVERTGLTKDTIRFHEKKGLIALNRKVEGRITTKNILSKCWIN